MPTLTTHLEEYLESLKTKNPNPDLLSARKKDLQSFLSWCRSLNLQDPLSLIPPVLERYRRGVMESGGPGTKPAAKRRKILSLKNFIRWLSKTGALPYNPASELSTPSLLNLPREILTPEEIKTVLKLPPLTTPYGIRDRAILEVLRSTGLRRKELVSLRVFDFQKDRNLLVVRGDPIRAVPMDKMTLKHLSHYLTESRPYLQTTLSEDILFLTRLGKSFSEQAISRLISNLLMDSGILKRGACRLFRNTCLRRLIIRGYPGKLIREFLGIKDPTQSPTFTTGEYLNPLFLAAKKNQPLKNKDPEPDQKTLTLKQAVTLFLKEKKVRTAKRTFSFYKNNLKRLSEWFGSNTLQSLDRATITAYIARRKKEGAFENTISREIQDLNSLLKFAHTEGLIQELKRFSTLPKEENQNPITIIDREDFEKVLSHITYPQVRLALKFMRYMGLRKSEALKMRHRWVDRKKGFLHIHSDAHFKTKTKRGRILKIPPPLFQEYLSLPTQSEWVHTSWKKPGKPLTDLRKILNNACKSARIKPFTLKDLRHSFNTTLAEQGVPSKIRALLMGHTTTAVTDNVYTHVRDRVLDEIMDGVIDTNQTSRG